MLHFDFLHVLVIALLRFYKKISVFVVIGWIIILYITNNSSETPLGAAAASVAMLHQALRSNNKNMLIITYTTTCQHPILSGPSSVCIAKIFLAKYQIFYHIVGLQ